MLYDPKWKKTNETKADPFSLDSLIAWLETMPADKEYDFWCTECLLGQYFAASGFDVQMVGTAILTHKDGGFQLPPNFNKVAMKKPYTFGAALERARAARARS